MMAKRDKREQRIRQNPKQVSFPDLDAVMRDHDFDGNPNVPHVIYAHERHGDLTVNVPKPHAGEKHVKAPYVRKALAAIDEAIRRDEADKDGDA
jgi:hypothetical protein